MCGISVIFDPAGRAEQALVVAEMTSAVAHRGPQGERLIGIDAAGRARELPAAPGAAREVLWLGFRRLSILDLRSAAMQPMVSPDGRFWIVFNGAIYNHAALRDELRALGRGFSTTSDSEVVLAAFERWREGCFERLQGMWAVVIVDLVERRLVACRDRFGIKPLFWTLDEGRLLLASEIRQLLIARRASPVANRALVASFLAGTRFPCLEETFFEGIEAVPAATWFETPLDDQLAPALRFRPYWSLADHYCAEPDARSYAETQIEFESVLREVVDAHRRSDVVVGCLVSGGLDSAVLAGLMARGANQDRAELPTFSLVLEDRFEQLSERRFSRAVVEHAGLVNHEASLTADWVATNLDASLRALEEPLPGMPPLAQLRVYAMVGENGVRAVLDGLGADEVLGGYDYYQRALYLDHLRRGRLAELSRELVALWRHEGGGLLRLLGRHVLRPLGRRLKRHASGWLAPEALRLVAERGADAAGDSGPDRSLANQRLYRQFKFGHLKAVLALTDRAAMAHSVEARVPYLDHRIVELAFRLPDRFKVGRGQRKRILRDVARGCAPELVTERVERTGYSTPDADWMRGPLRNSVRAAVADRRLRGCGFVVPAAVDELLAGFESGAHEDARSLFRLLTLARWSQVFGVALP